MLMFLGKIMELVKNSIDHHTKIVVVMWCPLVESILHKINFLKKFFYFNLKC